MRVDPGSLEGNACSQGNGEGQKGQKKEEEKEVRKLIPICHTDFRLEFQLNKRLVLPKILLFSLLAMSKYLTKSAQ